MYELFRCKLGRHDGRITRACRSCNTLAGSRMMSTRMRNSRQTPREGLFYDQAVLYTTNPEKAQAGPGGHKGAGTSHDHIRAWRLVRKIHHQ